GPANVPYLLAWYLFRYVDGRKSSAKLSGGNFIGRLAHHFGLLSDDGSKTSSNFNTIVREYVTEPSKLSKTRAELRRDSDLKCVKADGKVIEFVK
nr:hypothetical protein [Tanacetum cinerariifolium]